MAVTHGHGNPDWTRDEVLLALDLYFQLDGKIPGPEDLLVIELSRILRSIPIHKDARKNERFRNPAGVAFKLQNLRQVATGRGLGNVSATDKAVWDDYGKKQHIVHALAVQIREQGDIAELITEDVAAIAPDEEFVEGRVLTALHKVRERSPKLRRQLLTKRREVGALSCDACGDGPKISDSALAEAGFEGHHVVPLANGAARRTKVGEMALLCATCHRLIHRAMSVRRTWMSVEELRGQILPRPKAS